MVWRPEKLREEKENLPCESCVSQFWLGQVNDNKIVMCNSISSKQAVFGGNRSKFFTLIVLIALSPSPFPQHIKWVIGGWDLVGATSPRD